MKKAIVAALLSVLLLTGCGNRAPKQYDDRIKYAGGDWTHSIYIDKETGVCYLVAGHGLTVMVNADGTPFVANGWRDDGGENRTD